MLLPVAARKKVSGFHVFGIEGKLKGAPDVGIWRRSRLSEG